jgi:hypothetical protein
MLAGKIIHARYGMWSWKAKKVERLRCLRKVKKRRLLLKKNVVQIRIH